MYKILIEEVGFLAKKDKKVKEPMENGQYTEDFYAKQNRRYVGTKETLGFIIWDAAQSFNINIFVLSVGNRFNYNYSFFSFIFF